MQWVLFYYYRGVQHWGYFYKYHYPPMISDLKDIESLLGTTTIENFDHVDSVNRPFFPFQQLLTILPPDSIANLLPKCYYDEFIENPKFKEFYPLTFDQDLNGRSMPWESIILIPFIDEKMLIDHERKLEREGKLIMSESDIFRNQRGIEKIYQKEMTLSDYPLPEPEFKGFEFGHKNKCKIAEIPPYEENYVGTYFIDYKTTDPTIVRDFPSMHNLLVAKMTLQPVNFRGTRFTIPQVYIDHSEVKNLDLEKIAKDVVTRKNESIYVDYPFKHEAFIYCIVTLTHYYNVYNCWEAGSTRGLVSQTMRDQWNEATGSVNRAFKHLNIICQKSDVIVGFNRVKCLRWNTQTHTYEKVYKTEVEYLPIQMVSFERDEDHYLNLYPRIQEPLIRFQPHKNCLVLDDTYYGLTANVKQVSEEGKINEKFCYYDVNINNKIEESKIRDLFFARNICNKLFPKEPIYHSADTISKRLSKSFHLINRITSSIFIKYTENNERKTVDIGLKLRNSTQKLHIPFDVVYSEEFDKFGTLLQFWGFSEKAEETIASYLKEFPWIQHYVEARAHNEFYTKSNKTNKAELAKNTLEDALPFIEKEEERLAELNRLIKYLSECELANRSFVPAGFTFLSVDARRAIDDKIEQLKEKENRPVPSSLEKVDPRVMFAEIFPFWTPPFLSNNKDFRFGDRVININTTKRKFIPFGEIGTVIGFTLKDVIVRFDEPNVSLTDVHDTCLPYTGAVVAPQNLINLTYKGEMKQQQKQAQNYRQYGAPKQDQMHTKPSGGKGGKGKFSNSSKGYGNFNPKKGAKKGFFPKD